MSQQITVTVEDPFGFPVHVQETDLYQATLGESGGGGGAFYTAGIGLSLDGTTFNVNLDPLGGLEINSQNYIRLKTVSPTLGGTGITQYALGDMLYASSTNTLARLAIGSAGSMLQIASNGIPQWVTEIDGGTY